MKRISFFLAVFLLVSLLYFSLPDKVSAAIVPATLDSGGFYSCMLTDLGGVKCWGYNRDGELGDGTTTQRNTPIDVVGLTSGVAAVESGDYQTCAITTSGGVKCWGNNFSGWLGIGGSNPLIPSDIVGLTSGVAAVLTGRDHTCALTTSGGVKCWGYNGFGGLGDGTTTDSSVPVDVTGLTSGVAAITVGGYHSCALMTDGSAKCWGDNHNGQLGDEGVSGPTSNIPVDVFLTEDITGISAGMFHTCGLTTSGGVKCWGENMLGQLGDGGTTRSNVPLDVVGLTSGVSAISATSYYFTCAIISTGGVKCWGENNLGQLGDGTTTQSSIPVDVVGLTNDAIKLSVGGYHACVIDSADEIKCWGDNQYGQLGNGNTTASSVPVGVVFTPQLVALSPAKVWVGLKNSDDVGTKFDLLAEAYKDNLLVTSGQLNTVGGGSSGFNNALLDTISFNNFSPVNFPSGSTLKLKLYVRNACTGSGHNSGTARLWYNDNAANSRFGATVETNSSTYFLLNGLVLGTSAGSGPKKTVDVQAGAKCSPFKPFGTWTITP